MVNVNKESGLVNRTGYSGGCLCGAVRLELDGFESGVSHCHCQMCRKFHGAAFATFATVKKSSFRWLAGENKLKEFRAAIGTVRTFCSECGSSLTFASPAADTDNIEVALGIMEGDLPVRPEAHIFVGSSASWFVITDDLPQFVAGREEPESK